MKLFSKSQKENSKSKKSNVQKVDKNQLEKIIGGTETTTTTTTTPDLHSAAHEAAHVVQQ